MTFHLLIASFIGKYRPYQSSRTNLRDWYYLRHFLLQLPSLSSDSTSRWFTRRRIRIILPRFRASGGALEPTKVEERVPNIDTRKSLALLAACLEPKKGKCYCQEHKNYEISYLWHQGESSTMHTRRPFWPVAPNQLVQGLQATVFVAACSHTPHLTMVQKFFTFDGTKSC